MQIKQPQDLRKAARVLSKRGCVNRRTTNLELDSLPFRLNQHDLPPVDVTVSARDAARVASPLDLRISLEKHWKNITERW